MIEFPFVKSYKIKAKSSENLTIRYTKFLENFKPDHIFYEFYGIKAKEDQFQINMNKDKISFTAPADTGTYE